MRLLIVTQKVDRNEQLLGFFVEWIRRFAYQFERVNVICLEKGEFELPENVKVLSLGKDYGASKLKQLLTFYFQLYTLRNDYDAVLVHMNPIWMVLGGLPWRLLGKKTTLWYTHKAVTLKLRLAELFAQRIFTASKESFRLPSDKVIVTGHGIDTGLFQPSEKLKVKSEKLMILSVGRIAKVKNYGTLIDAAKLLHDAGFMFHVDMVGEPALQQDKEYQLGLKQEIQRLGLNEYFSFIGKVNNADLPECYRAHDLFVHLSRTGSVDKVLLEAMACGMQVLSSNDSAKSFLPPELIFDDENPAQLAGKIRTSAGRLADSTLRDYVMQHHNLDRLIGEISRHIKA